MRVHSFRQFSSGLALVFTLALVASACSGSSPFQSPTSPSGVAATAASSSAVSGVMEDTPEPCPAVSGVLEDGPADPGPDPCDPPECDSSKDECEPPPPPGDEGCTPGYWKNHVESWQVYAPGATLTSVFGSDALSGTLLDALGFGGGSGIVGAKRILLRAAAAALLNAAHSGVDYTETTGAIIDAVTDALGGSREEMLALAASLDADNNLGCPLN
jgi:hypothetical protein